MPVTTTLAGGGFGVVLIEVDDAGRRIAGEGAIGARTDETERIEAADAGRRRPSTVLVEAAELGRRGALAVVGVTAPAGSLPLALPVAGWGVATLIGGGRTGMGVLGVVGVRGCRAFTSHEVDADETERSDATVGASDGGRRVSDRG